ncbi:MAG: protein translocase subunit SecD, partial [Anaerolineales bacterium]|nr:protein translocase subunit SecD [Anaerolineales bacterium]
MKKSQRWVIPILIALAFAIWVDLPSNPGIHIGNIDRSIDFHLGLDLVGGVQALLEADLPPDVTVNAEAMRTSRTIVENRVNGLGVSEAVVQLAGDRRILVELPGEQDPEKAISTIKQTALLEFAHFGDQAYPPGTVIKTDFVTGSQEQEQPQTEETTTAGISPETVFHTVMTGAMLKNAYVTQDKLGKPIVAIELNDEGAKVFKDYTTNNVGQILAIILDKKVISTPRIQDVIPDGHAVITGDFTIEEANNLAIQLRYGALPVPLKVVQSKTVGPTLGQDSLRKSLFAGIIGMISIILFMAIYYRLPGLVADIALIIYATVSLALFKLIPITLTLPGIAGFILTIGVAVDANVLIFERLKEELRAGRTIRQAIDLGWNRAWPSIRD